MTTDQNKLVVRRYIEEVANTGNDETRLRRLLQEHITEPYQVSEILDTAPQFLWEIEGAFVATART